MLLYHIDRHGSFPAEKDRQLHQAGNMSTPRTVELLRQWFPDGVGALGLLYAVPFFIEPDEEAGNGVRVILNNYDTFSKEYIFEIVRRYEFPDRPSRLTSIFACDEPSLKEWFARLNPNRECPSDPLVRIIAPDNGFFEADAFWRDMPIFCTDAHGKQTCEFSPFSLHAQAVEYWRGVRTDHPRIECLCRLPVTVVDSIPLSQLIQGL